MKKWEKIIQKIRRQLQKYGNVQSLMQYVNETTLIDKHRQLDGNKATGVDKVAKRNYEHHLEEINKCLI